MFVKLTEKRPGVEEWHISTHECDSARYVPCEDESDLSRGIRGVLYMEPSCERITVWDASVNKNTTHIYLLNSIGKTIDKIV